jgi:hypothetical protein
MAIQHATRHDREWTWSDYRTWPAGECWEIIGGAAFGGDEVLPFGTLDGVAIPLWEVFELPEPGSVPVVKGPSG